MDPSRYATSPSAKVFAVREANRESNSRILPRYAADNFDRPPRSKEAKNDHQPLKLHHQPLISLEFAF
ncbi:hypothetical protein E3N88_04358 [Mikania micrantha]|uniref:Uncharacterized protein n=1 Tax=Mikania micrantha TaxID=192012 RepID=A0A5N6PX18_9ASTR|nr:hypothetical protein E3N88_04358 [Mikania micrantha]